VYDFALGSRCGDKLAICGWLAVVKSSANDDFILRSVNRLFARSVGGEVVVDSLDEALFFRGRSWGDKIPLVDLEPFLVIWMRFYRLAQPSTRDL
jgi:hypothetical protein